eukprot:s8989_g2.t1
MMSAVLHSSERSGILSPSRKLAFACTSRDKSSGSYVSREQCNAVNCWTSRYAGAFRTRDNFELYGGLVSIRSSHSLQRGGSLMADYVKVFGGELSIRDTRTHLEG